MLATPGSLLHGRCPMSADATSFYTESSKHGTTEPPKGHTYKQSGVDIREAAALVGDIGQLVKRTQKQRQLAGAFGLFAAAYDLSAYKHPVRVGISRSRFGDERCVGQLHPVCPLDYGDSRRLGGGLAPSLSPRLRPPPTAFKRATVTGPDAIQHIDSK